MASMSVGRLLQCALPTLALVLAASCGSEAPPGPGIESGVARVARESAPSAAGEERVKAELQDRSFRQFVPSVDADPRRGVILSFFGPLTIWAQYAEAGHALNEWEIAAADYRVEQHGSLSEITLHLDQPTSAQGIPTRCDDCIPTDGVSLSIRNVFDGERTEFRLNDPNGVLPRPFPVFGSWTRFVEDEVVN